MINDDTFSINNLFQHFLIMMFDDVYCKHSISTNKMFYLRNDRIGWWQWWWQWWNENLLFKIITMMMVIIYLYTNNVIKDEREKTIWRDVSRSVRLLLMLISSESIVKQWWNEKKRWIINNIIIILLKNDEREEKTWY